MNKLLLLFAIVCLSCKSSYKKADEALEIIKREQNALDSISVNAKGDTTNLSYTISGHQLLISAYKTIFKQELDGVNDEVERLKLIQKFDRIYVLRIEK